MLQNFWVTACSDLKLCCSTLITQGTLPFYPILSSTIIILYVLHVTPIAMHGFSFTLAALSCWPNMSYYESKRIRDKWLHFNRTVLFGSSAKGNTDTFFTPLYPDIMYFSDMFTWNINWDNVARKYKTWILNVLQNALVRLFHNTFSCHGLKIYF